MGGGTASAASGSRERRAPGCVFSGCARNRGGWGDAGAEALRWERVGRVDYTACAPTRSPWTRGGGLDGEEVGPPPTL